MKILKCKLLFHKLFPRLYKIEDTLEEVSMRQDVQNTWTVHFNTDYIQWEIFEEQSNILVDVKHTYTRNGKELGTIVEKAVIPFLFAHAEPVRVRPVSGVEVDIRTLKGMPVFQIRGQMYDVTKIGYPDYMSMTLKKGKLLDRAKSSGDISEEYDKWLEDLEIKSTDIMANARC